MAAVEGGQRVLRDAAVRRLAALSRDGSLSQAQVELAAQGLGVSARTVWRAVARELKRLLKGSPVEQDLLGLLTAARGGLSGEDLHELTGAGLIEVEDVLHTVAGRTFTSRAPQWAGVDGPLAYLLGHEELQQAAVGYLGTTRLAGYRARIHAWAGSYRNPDGGRPAWPAGTPEYLLASYPGMLARHPRPAPAGRPGHRPRPARPDAGPVRQVGRHGQPAHGEVPGAGQQYRRCWSH